MSFKGNWIHWNYQNHLSISIKFTFQFYIGFGIRLLRSGVTMRNMRIMFPKWKRKNVHPLILLHHLTLKSHRCQVKQHLPTLHHHGLQHNHRVQLRRLRSCTHHGFLQNHGTLQTPQNNKWVYTADNWISFQYQFWAQPWTLHLKLISINKNSQIKGGGYWT